MKKITSGIIAGMLAVSMLSANASAMTDYSIFWDSGGLHIKGRTSGGNANMGVSITDSSGKPIYANQVKSDENGSFSFVANAAYGDDMTVRLSDASTGETITENSQSLKSGIEIYPDYPDIIPKNDDFAVTVAQNGIERPLSVYDTGITYTEDDNTYVRHRRFCEFAFTGDGVTVTVTPKEEYSSYEVIAHGTELPSVKNDDGSISIELDKPRNFIVRLDGDTWFSKDMGKVLCVLADEPHAAPSGSNVIYKAAGLHEEDITLTGGQTLYLAPGAVVKGKMKVTGTNVKICGTGMLYDPNETNGDGRYMLGVGPSYNTQIQDVKIVGRSRGNYNITLSGADNAVIDNVRILSCMISDDGISVFSGSDNLKIKNCFIYNIDDALVMGGSSRNYPSKTEITGCLIGTTCSVFAQAYIGIVNAVDNTAFEMASGTDKKHGLMKCLMEPPRESWVGRLTIKNFDASHANITAKMMWIQGSGSKYKKNIKLINVRMREPDATLWGSPHYDFYMRSSSEIPESSGYNIEINGLYFDDVEVTDAKMYSRALVPQKNTLLYGWNESTNKISFLPSAEKTGVLLAPEDLTAEMSGRNLQLEWTEKNIDADGYNIYKNGEHIGTSILNSYQLSEFAAGDVFAVSAVWGDTESEKSADFVNTFDGTPVSNRLAVYKDTYGNNAEENEYDNVRAHLSRRFVGSPKDSEMINKIGFELWHNDNAITRASVDSAAAEGDNVVRFFLRPKTILDCGTNFAGEGFSFTNMTSGGLTTVDLSECEQQGYVIADVYIGELKKSMTTDDIYITLGDLKDCTNGDYIADDTHSGNSGNALLSENLVGVKLSDYYSDSDVGTFKTIKIPLTEFTELGENSWHYSYAGVKRGINLRRLSYIGYVWAPADVTAEYDSSSQFIYMDNISVQNVIAPEIDAEPAENNTTSLSWKVKNSDIRSYDIIKNGRFYTNVEGNAFTDTAESTETDEYSVVPVNSSGYRAYSVNRVNVKLWDIGFYSAETPTDKMKSGDITVKGELMPGVSGSIIVCRYDKNGRLIGSQLVKCTADNKFECTETGCSETDRITVYFWNSGNEMFPKAVERTL